MKDKKPGAVARSSSSTMARPKRPVRSLTPSMMDRARPMLALRSTTVTCANPVTVRTYART
jgi:hypothetical protein